MSSTVSPPASTAATSRCSGRCSPRTVEWRWATTAHLTESTPSPDFEESSHAQAGHTLHRMTNHAIDIDDNHAKARSYVDAWIMSQDNASGINVVGFYDDELVRTERGWRIKRRVFTQVRLSVHSS